LNRLEREIKALNTLAKDEFVTRQNLPGLVSEKADKSDLAKILQELPAVEEKMKAFTTEMGVGIEDRTQDRLKKLDKRIVELRREVDVDSFKQLVSVKADK